ncbi:MAG: hypothetical protein KAS32_02515 [Candidatus Peribacteraceae bacterium]|nr:hypothetical protein [Candidatus Peribacteraceae bacterium]
MKTFKDLMPEPKMTPKDEAAIKEIISEIEEWVQPMQALMYFDNGYGVSVISGWGAYSGDEGLYELAVMKKGKGITYDTPITSDVEGHLTEDDVTGLMIAVQCLPKAE